MQLTREDFQKFLYTYNEDELFYRTLYFEKKEHPETFHKFCLNLDCDLISRRQLYVPELQKEGWHSYFEEKAMFCDTADNIILYKHYRYTPEFIHEHEFFEFYVFMMARLIPLFRELSILCIKAMSASFRHIQNTVSVFLMTVSLLIS